MLSKALPALSSQSSRLIAGGSQEPSNIPSPGWYIRKVHCKLLLAIEVHHFPLISEPTLVKMAASPLIFSAVSQVIEPKIKPCSTAAGKSSGIVQLHKNLKRNVPITRVTAALIRILAPEVILFEMSIFSSNVYSFIRLSPSC